MSLRLERTVIPRLWAPALAALLLLAGCKWLERKPGRERPVPAGYTRVTLQELNASPKDYVDRKVCFDACFAGRTALYVPFNTQFTSDEYVNFTVWPANAKLWLAADMEATCPRLYVLRRDGGVVEGNPEKPLAKLDTLKRYQLVTLCGTVASDRDNLAWLVVDSILTRPGTPYTAESIRRLQLATERMGARQYAAAARDFSAALEKGLPSEVTPAVCRDLGVCLAAEENYAGAVKSLAVAEEKGVADVEALAVLADARIETGDFAGAEKSARAALAADPKSLSARAQLAVALARGGRIPAALDEVADALKLSPADAPDAGVLRAKGIVLDASGPAKLDEAIDSYRSAVRARPTDPRIQRELGGLLVKKGDLAGAKEAYENVITLSKDSNLGYCRGNCLLAGVFEKQNKPEDAARCFLLAQKRDPGYIPAYLGLGALLVAGGRGDDALAQYRMVAEKLDPNGDNGFLAWRRCAEIYRAKNNPEATKKAAECLEKASVIRPGDYQNWMDLADARWEQAQPDRAGVVVALRKAAAVDPKKGLPHFRLGKVMLEQAKAGGDSKKVVEASVELQTARGLDPNHVPTRLLLAQTYRRLCRDEQAQAELEEALKKDGGNADVKNSLAFLLADLGGTANLIRAEKLIGEAVAAKPGEVAYQDTLGWVQARSNKLKEAEDTLTKAANASSEAVVLYHLGFAQVGNGKYAAAVETLGKAQRSQRQGPKICASCEKLEKDIAKLLDQAARDKARAEADAKRKADQEKAKPPAPAPKK